MKKLKQEFSNITKMRMFEIPVLDKANELDYILCDLSIQGDNLVASRVGLSTEEEESDKIATSSIELDDVFSLDENLQALYEKIVEDIVNGDLYHLV